MKKNSDVFSEVVVGVFMVAVLALLVYFTVVISGVDVLFGREKALARIAFTDVGGLKERDNVVYRGMKVGIVEKIELAPTNVMVTVLVDRGVVLREGCHASVSALSLLGGNYLLLEEGAGAVQPLATTVFRGDPPIDWVRDRGKIAGSLNEVLKDGSFRSISANFEGTGGAVNTIVARVERGEGTAGRLLSRDDTVYQDLREAVAGAKRAVGDAEKTFDGARQTFDHAAAVAERLGRGEGTLGRLMTERELYDEVTATIKDVRQIIDNYRDTTPITTFGALATGAL